LRPLAIHRKGEVLWGQDGATEQGLPELFQGMFPDISPKYMDPLSLMAGIAAGRALDGAQASWGEEVRRNFAVILGTAFGAIDSSLDFDRQALLQGPNTVNPMDFPNTVANAAGSRIGIWLQLKGPNVTLTNGGTSLLDAIGFAWEGLNSGLFQQCLTGAADKVPASLAAIMNGPAPSGPLIEGACLFLASGEAGPNDLFEVVDFFAAQLKPDLSLPKGFKDRLEELSRGAGWLGCPQGMPLPGGFLSGLVPSFTAISTLSGLMGLDAINRFLSLEAPSCGVIGAFSYFERKISLIKINRKKERSTNG